MPVDPILAYHAIGFHRYELSCLRTRNVRDQILRAELLVERLVARGVIGPGRELLVLGGGAGGLSSALAACTRGVDVVVIEIEPGPVSKQYGVRTRRLHPCEFDWPQPHWRDTTMALPGSFALEYSADTAHGVALAWRQTLEDVITGATPTAGKLTIYRGDAKALRIRKLRTAGFVGAVPWTGYAHGRPFGSVISCIGFSGERTAIQSTTKGALHGPLFWSTDELDEPGLGVVRSGMGPVRALVSGGGDGAQQDFLRILTGKFGIELSDALGLPTLAKKLPLMADALLAEDAALRALALAVPGAILPQSYQRWHHAYEQMAASIWRSWRRRGDVPSLLGLLKPDVEATWLVGDDVPGYCYGLNRLLASLVARLHAHARGRPYMASARSASAGVPLPVIITGSRANSVTPLDPASHTCGTACYGHEHEIEVSLSGGVIQSLGQFDVIVPRHGIIQTPLIGWPPVHEQRVAFDRPS